LEAFVILTEDARLHRLLRYLKEDLSRPVSLAEAARVVGSERTYFSRFFRVVVGCTFSDWSRGLRIEKAKTLLRRRGPTIFSVAGSVGYSDMTTFGRAFKKQTGMSPRAYRNTCEPRPFRQATIVAHSRYCSTAASAPVRTLCQRTPTLQTKADSTTTDAENTTAR
jgi:AraC-like DNA-binding protein